MDTTDAQHAARLLGGAADVDLAAPAVADVIAAGTRARQRRRLAGIGALGVPVAVVALALGPGSVNQSVAAVPRAVATDVAPRSAALQAPLGFGPDAMRPWFDVDGRVAGIELESTPLGVEWTVSPTASGFVLAGTATDAGGAADAVVVGMVEGPVTSAACDGRPVEPRDLGRGWTVFGTRYPADERAVRAPGCTWVGPDGRTHASNAATLGPR